MSKTALLVIDMQEDFCEPVCSLHIVVDRCSVGPDARMLTALVQSGALAVQGSRDTASVINKLLKLPFAAKYGTMDSHPPDHCSFASQHPNASPFTSSHTIKNPLGGDEEQTTLLWPDHCVQGTFGEQRIPEVDWDSIDAMFKKGMDRRVESYSGFGPPFRNPRVQPSELQDALHKEEIKTVVVVGLAFDYCVKYTALDAAKAGFGTYVVEDATRAVQNSEKELAQTKEELKAHGVRIITSQDEVLRSMAG